MELYLLIVLPVLASLLLYLIPARITTWLTSILYAAVFGVTVWLFIRIRFGGEILSTGGGKGFLGISLYCDLTSSVFLVLVSFLFLCLFLYTNLPERVDKLYSFLITVLEGLVMLIFLSRDLFNLYAAVEVATLVCAALIMFKRESRSIYDGLVFLLTNITGMLFFLLGTGMIYRQLGVLDFDGIQMLISTRTPQELVLPYAMIMTGVCLNCAMLPFHFWIPLAHGTPGAPTAVTAILSGLYIKSSVYLFMRVQTLFAPVIDSGDFFFWLGVVTSLAGIVMAVCQRDIKMILAYHTISQIGLIVAGLSTGNPTAQAGAILHIFNHALFKTLLSLSAGILINKYHTRNIYQIKGVMRSLPLVGISVACGVLGITGAPFFNGSISKYFLAKGGATAAADLMFLLINFGTILSFVKFGKMLLGPKKEFPFRYDFFSTAVMLVLSLLCLVTGIFAEPVILLLFNLQLEVGLVGYLEKTAIWAVSLLGAGVLYWKVLSHSARLKAGIDFTISFNGIALCLGAGFLMLLASGFAGALGIL